MALILGQLEWNFVHSFSHQTRSELYHLYRRFRSLGLRSFPVPILVPVPVVTFMAKFIDCYQRDVADCDGSSLVGQEVGQVTCVSKV